MSKSLPRSEGRAGSSSSLSSSSSAAAFALAFALALAFGAWREKSDKKEAQTVCSCLPEACAGSSSSLSSSSSAVAFALAFAFTLGEALALAFLGAWLSGVEGRDRGKGEETSRLGLRPARHRCPRRLSLLAPASFWEPLLWPLVPSLMPSANIVAGIS